MVTSSLRVRSAQTQESGSRSLGKHLRPGSSMPQVFALRSIVLVLATLGCTVMASAQQRFVDDAGRRVSLPASVSRVFAAGAPAEVLLYTLVPEMLVGRNHLPSPDAQEFVPPEYRSPIQIRQLPDARDNRADGELLALKPDIYVDYGDISADYIRSVGNVQQRTGVPAIILDGRLDRIPRTYRRLGKALGVRSRGEQLATAAQRVLDKYRGAARVAGRAPRVYLACSADGTIPCLEGERNGEVARWVGAVNVAGNVGNAQQRPVALQEIRAWNPEVIVAASADAAARILSDAAWQEIPAVAAKRVVALPTLPFNWGPRPPSVNRLLGMIWLSRALSGRAFDQATADDVRQFFSDFYHVTLTDHQLMRLMGP